MVDDDDDSKEKTIRKEFFIIKKFHAIITISFFVLICVTILVLSFVFSFKIANNNNEINEKCMKHVENLTIKNDVTMTSLVVKVDYRLPQNIKPYLYDLIIKTNFYDDIEPVDFNGTVKIYFKCFKQTDKVILHVKNLDIFNSSIKVNQVSPGLTAEFKVKDLVYDLEREFLIIELDSPFFDDRNYVVTIQYKGYLKDDNIGFYRSSYFDSQGNKRWLFASQMQPTDARKAFPSFDEPAMKAKFKITAIHHRDYFAISNMHVVSTKTL
jgi:aminopeptidase N